MRLLYARRPWSESGDLDQRDENKKHNKIAKGKKKRAARSRAFFLATYNARAHHGWLDTNHARCQPRTPSRAAAAAPNFTGTLFVVAHDVVLYSDTFVHTSTCFPLLLAKPPHRPSLLVPLVETGSKETRRPNRENQVSSTKGCQTAASKHAAYHDRSISPS